MDIYWDKTAWDDYLYWIETDRKIMHKINSLIKECQRTPFSGSGNPEPLKQNLNGFWSRRINSEHRLVYRIDENVLFIAQCRYHY
ncbi:MAG: Txe/YoeB family addiction module toxin [Bacteroidota bacterium]|nr:Txe/YoeB family addiction module toxin [Odoribacter sp.]MDP3644765.1 Txe/YoeB family addiction module toxin [Bacteroidota bacterium]